MRQLFISAGHSNDPKGDRGAVGINGVLEGDLTIDFRDRLVKVLKQKGVSPLTDDNKNSLKATLQVLNSLLKSDKTIALDIHWNAFNGVAEGAEVIIPHTPTQLEINLAKELSLNICETTGIKNRGVKGEHQTARKRLGWMRVNCENILIEVCFIDNKKDMDNYYKFRDVIINRVANTLIKYIKL